MPYETLRIYHVDPDNLLFIIHLQPLLESLSASMSPLSFNSRESTIVKKWHDCFNQLLVASKNLETQSSKKKMWVNILHSGK